MDTKLSISPTNEFPTPLYSWSIEYDSVVEFSGTNTPYLPMSIPSTISKNISNNQPDGDILKHFDPYGSHLLEFINKGLITSKNMTEISTFIEEWMTIIDVTNNIPIFNIFVSKILDTWAYVNDISAQNNNKVMGKYGFHNKFCEYLNYYILNKDIKVMYANLYNLILKQNIYASQVSDKEVYNLTRIIGTVKQKKLIPQPPCSIEQHQIMIDHNIYPHTSFIDINNYVKVKSLSRIICNTYIFPNTKRDSSPIRVQNTMPICPTTPPKPYAR